MRKNETFEDYVIRKEKDREKKEKRELKKRINADYKLAKKESDNFWKRYA